MLGTRWKNKHVHTIVVITDVIREKENRVILLAKDVKSNLTRKWEEQYFLRHHIELGEEE